MLNIHTLPLGSYQTNCYIVHQAQSSACVIIDPGYDPDAISAFLAEKGLTAEAILLTHGHFDHVGAVEALVEQTHCRLIMHPSDWAQKTDPMTAYFYPLANCDFTEVEFCQDGAHIFAAGLDFLTIATPGHTRGSVCYLCAGTLFSGDTLFDGSCGRTDLPGGNWDTIQDSLRRLAQLEGDPTVCPGHGNSTALAAQRQYNPYMR